MQQLHIFLLFVIIWFAHVSGDVSTDSSEDGFHDEEDEDYDYGEFNSTSNGTLQFVKELTDITRDVGKNVRFVCEVKHLDPNTTNPKVTINWKKNNALITTEEKRMTIKRFDRPEQQLYKSVLRIARLEPLDQSFYECVASNGINKIKSEAALRIPLERWNGAASSDIPSYRPLYEDKHNSNNGHLGDITTFLPNTNHNGGGEFLSTIPNPVLPNLNEQTINNPILFEGTPNIIKQKMTGGVPTYNESEPFCQLYTGGSCKDFLADRYVFVQPPYSQGHIEEMLENAFLVIKQSKDISASCNKFAVPSLCFSAFPLCVDPVQTNTYQKQYINNKYKMSTEKDKRLLKDIRNKLSMSLQRICKEDCKLLETELCSTEYAIAKRHPVLAQTLELEECEFLPEETIENSKHCLRLGVSQTVDKDDNCYWDRGDMYRGVKDTSVSGAACIRWAHQFHIPLSEHPELTGHNYCRNPGNIEVEPFCYVEYNKKQIKEACGIRKCAYILGMYIGASFVGLLTVGIAVVYYCCKKHRKGTRALQNMTPTAGKNIYGNPSPNSPMEMNTLLPHNIPPQRNHHSNKNGFQNLVHYTYKEVTFVEELGEGAFGKVYKGELKTKSGKIFVAVKSLKENASAKTQADFQREIELISELKHPNIICLLGVVMKQEPMCMLFEFMSEGDLHEFLIANSPSQGKSLAQNQFLQIAIQIAQGMEYLSENHYVHRDLAARNCLVTKDLVVKISDFGLSRDMYSCDYYRVQSKSLLPVRWMPPESILYGKFTTESDVWSYGVVLWEIYSYGLQPYYGYNNQEVINMIRSRKLLPCPEACPGYCYALMVECWAELAIRRPSFGEISHRLRVWKQNGNSGAYFKQPEVYTNPQKYGHSSKSSHTSDSQTLCPTFDNLNDPSSTWERNLKKTSANKLNESQSSLTSRSSSLGNKTQSTNLSNEHNSRGSRKSTDRKSQKAAAGRSDDTERHARNIVVSSNGANFESKLTH